MGKYLDILDAQARAENYPCAKSAKSAKRVSEVVSGDAHTDLPRLNRFSRIFSALKTRCPDHVPADRWELAVEDGRRFLAGWGQQAEALDWTVRDLFGLHKPPEKPHPSYSPLSRYDETGLIWLLQGREVVALTAATATIKSATGVITVYRKHNKPALGPLGDSLDDFK